MKKNVLFAFAMLAVLTLAFPQSKAFASACEDACHTAYLRDMRICARFWNSDPDCPTAAVIDYQECLATCQ